MDYSERGDWERAVAAAIIAAWAPFTNRWPLPAGELGAAVGDAAAAELEPVYRRSILAILLWMAQEDDVARPLVDRFDNNDERATQLARAQADKLAADFTASITTLTPDPSLEPAARETWVRETVLGPDRAARIAATEVTSAISQGEYAARDIGRTVSMAIVATWHTERDGLVCKICRPLDGQPEEVWRDVYPTGTPGHPNCVLGHTPVILPGVRAALRAKYYGPVVRIDAGAGGRFAVTPNHMFLTDLGFVRASDLVQGMNVVRTGFGKRVVTNNPNDDWQPVLAEKVFDACSVASSVAPYSVPFSAEDLHGDAAFVDGEIDVINTDRLLGRELYAPSGEPSRQLQFILAGLSNAFDGLSAQQLLSRGGCPASDCLVGSVREQSSILNRGLLHSQKHSLATVPALNTGSGQPMADHIAAYTEVLAELENAHPGMISLEQIVDVEWDRAGHGCGLWVYDFETESTLYAIGNGIVTSNCRCWLDWKIVRR